MAKLQAGPGRRIHHPKKHAAVRTDEYLFSQLIPYIGNKRKLLHLIDRAVQHTGEKDGWFVDLFTGATVVARWAKKQGFSVLANDWEPYSHQIAAGTVALNQPPSFAALGGAPAVFDRLNELTGRYGYIAENLCPADDDRPNPDRERMFFTRANGERIDAIGEQLAEWLAAGTISTEEYSYIQASLIYAVSYASNTSGVFKGFHRGWGGKTSTALYRIRGRLTLRPPVLFDNGRTNMALREDAHSLAGRLRDVCGERPAIAYIDPPYNQHPYGSNYHVLNTVALWDKPPVSPSIRGADGKVRDKSAIRKDWRTLRRSPYNFAREAPEAFRRLLDALDARWVLVSYSTDGNIPLEELLTTLADRGRLDLFAESYKRYRVSTPRMSPRSHNVEFVACLDKDAPASASLVAPLLDSLLRQQRDALR